MLSIDRVRTTTLTLLGMSRGKDDAHEPIPTEGVGIEQGDVGTYPGTSSDPVSIGTPIFDVVETALRDAGYLHS